MTQGTVPHTRLAPQRRPGVGGGSSWPIPLALVVVSLIPVIAGSLRLLEIAGGPELLPTNPRIDASQAPVVAHVSTAISVGSGWVINVVVAEWVIRRPSVRRASRARRAGRARTRAALAASQ